MRRGWRLVRRGGARRYATEELVHGGFLAAYRYLDTSVATRPFGPWLMRIVLNRGANLRRPPAPRETEPQTHAVSPPPPALAVTGRA